MPEIFSYQDYKIYLTELISARPQGGRGMRTGMAHAMNCQTAYISQVLNGLAHFSLEQGERLNRFLGHTDEESHYFLLLVQYVRAGTRQLKSYFFRQMGQVRKDRLVLKTRLEVKESLSERDQVTYYSAWYYSVVHVMLSIAEFQDKEAICAYLGLPLQQVSNILDFLVSVGLAEHEGGKYSIGQNRIHLGNDSPLVSKHHTNWRIRAIDSLDRHVDENLHYSSVVTLSREDVDRIKSVLVGQIQDVKSIVKESEEEEVYSYCLDFFQVSSQVPR